MIGLAPFSTFRWIASGQPPGGWPSSPFIICTTESGKAMSRAGSSTSAAESSCVTIISAMSPTTFEEGVTLTMSPNSWFASA